MHRNSESTRISFFVGGAMALALFSLTTSLTCTAQMPGQKLPGLVPISVEQTSRGIRATAGKEVLEATVCSESVIHVVAVPEARFPSPRVPGCLTRHNRVRALRSVMRSTINLQ